MSTQANNNTDMLENPNHLNLDNLDLKGKLASLMAQNLNSQKFVNTPSFPQNYQNPNQFQPFQQQTGEILDNSQNQVNLPNLTLPTIPEQKTFQQPNFGNLQTNEQIILQNPNPIQPKTEQPNSVQIPIVEINKPIIAKNEVKPFERKTKKPRNFVAKLKNFLHLERYHHPKFESKKPRDFQQELDIFRKEAMSKAESQH